MRKETCSRGSMWNGHGARAGAPAGMATEPRRERPGPDMRPRLLRPTGGLVRNGHTARARTPLLLGMAMAHARAPLLPRMATGPRRDRRSCQEWPRGLRRERLGLVCFALWGLVVAHPEMATVPRRESRSCQAWRTSPRPERPPRPGLPMRWPQDLGGSSERRSCQERLQGLSESVRAQYAAAQSAA